MVEYGGGLMPLPWLVTITIIDRNRNYNPVSVSHFPPSFKESCNLGYVRLLLTKHLNQNNSASSDSTHWG